MPDRNTVKKARADKRAGKSPSTQAGHFVEKEVHDLKRRQSPAKSRKQAVAIGLSKARAAGVKVAKKKKDKNG